jgi:catechol 2,3-dioxygenase-like lactoylglutathione lyase family enzyme
MNARNTPPPTLFAVEIRTARWDELVAWYRHVLGLRVLMRVVDDRYALLEVGPARLAILGRDTTGAASHRWSLGLEVDDLEATRARLLESGVPATDPIPNPEGFHELVVTDPDGNRLRLFAWNHDHHR